MNTLKAEKRSMDVKAKRLRREGYVTGNVFGREIEGSIPVKMLKTEVDKLLKTDHKGSQVMLEIDGQTYDALIKEVDFNPLAEMSGRDWCSSLEASFSIKQRKWIWQAS